MISTSLEASYQELAKERNQWIAFGIWILLVSSIALIHAIRTGVIRNVEKLSQAALKIAEGDFSQRVGVQSQDEIGALANTMNYMAEHLGSLYHNLEGAVAGRTKELNERLQELERFNKAMIQREYRVKELKEEVQALKQRIEELEKRKKDLA